jgi:anhydro-N-acetylmuramic acid kinase
MASTPELYLGLISGTSADGIDAALASFDPAPRLLDAITLPYAPALRRRVLDLAQGDGRIVLDELGTLDVAIGQAFAAAAAELLARSNVAPDRVRAIGSHGQTVRHRPALTPEYTLQLCDQNVIAERTGIATVADFRSRYVAAGGQGAPFAPAFHAAMLGRGDAARAVLNLGGIANVTLLPGDPSAPVLGFDTGPANCLLDAWAERNAGQPIDRGGAFAASGNVDAALLERLLADPYFALPPPKSTGREMFHLAWLQPHLTGGERPADVQATLLALSARTIADAVRTHADGVDEVVACGGGVHNPVLMAALADALAPIRLRSSADYGIDPDFVEAMLFAWLARERLARRPVADLVRVTGARGARVLGAVYFGG